MSNNTGGISRLGVQPKLQRKSLHWKDRETLRPKDIMALFGMSRGMIESMRQGLYPIFPALIHDGFAVLIPVRFVRAFADGTKLGPLAYTGTKHGGQTNAPRIHSQTRGRINRPAA